MQTNELEARVARLETKLGRARALNRAGLLALAVFLVAAAASPEVQESVRARKLEVVDANGRTVIELRSDEAGGRIALFGAAPSPSPRKVRVSIQTSGFDRPQVESSPELFVPPDPTPNEPQILLECGPEAGEVRIRNSRGNDAVLSPFPRLIPL